MDLRSMRRDARWKVGAYTREADTPTQSSPYAASQSMGGGWWATYRIQSRATHSAASTVCRTLGGSHVAQYSSTASRPSSM